MGIASAAKRVCARGRAHRAAAVALAAVVAVLCASCGGGDDDQAGTPSSSEKAADVEILNAGIEQELTLIAAYSYALSQASRALSGPARERVVPILEQLRGQAQEHVDGLTKAIRGAGGQVDAEEEEETDFSAARSESDLLTLAYELEGRALASYLDAAPRLETGAPRRLAASLAASEAQHLVVLRRLLGAGLAPSFPEAFDTGDVPPPPVAGEGPASSLEGNPGQDGE